PGWHPGARRVPAPPPRRSPGAARTIGSSRACPSPCLGARFLVVRPRRRALDPDFAAVEVLVLPDRRDLLHALDGVARGGVRLGAMRRRGDDCDARLADRDPSDAGVDAEPRVSPQLPGFVLDAGDRLD